MTKKNLVDELKEACVSGSLLTAKHDPGSKIQWGSFRTVLSEPMSSSLDEFIHSEKYEIDEYHNPSKNEMAYHIKPNDPSISPVGFGIQSGSLTPSGSYDSLIVISGSNQGCTFMLTMR